MRAILSLLLTISIAMLGDVSAAETTITRITHNAYEDSLPRIRGQCVVWQADMDGDREVFLYDIAAGVTSQITDNDYDDMSVHTDGAYVVWQGFEDGEWDIFLWDGHETVAISDRGVEDVCPQISNGRVVWAAEPFGEDLVDPQEIMLYDAGTGTRVVLSAGVDPDNTRDDHGPRINDEVVMWVQIDEENNTTRYVYDLSTGVITERPEYLWSDSFQRHGNLSVLTQYDGHDREVFLHNSESGRYHQISNSDFQDRYPSISENYVTWMSGGEIFLAECRYLALIRPGDDAILSVEALPTFAWEGIGYGGFKIEFSTEPDFTERSTLTLPLRGEKETSYTPTRLGWWFLRMMERRHGELFWRVSGQDREGSAAFSETSSFTIERADKKRRPRRNRRLK